MRIRLLGLLLGLLLGSPVAAQGIRTLTVEQGSLYVNGRRVAEKHVPPTLDLRSVNGHFSYSGSANSTIQINGLLYRFSGNRLVLETAPTRAPDAILGESLEERFSAVFAPSPGSVVTRVGWTSASSFEEAFFDDFAAQQEFALEASAEVLALEIRSLPAASAEREVLIHRLRAVLTEAFEVKQRNRLREIEALESEIEALRQQHRQRGRLRDRIVERRLGELIGVQVEGLR